MTEHRKKRARKIRVGKFFIHMELFYSTMVVLQNE